MKMIAKEYKIIKDGKDTERTVCFVVPCRPSKVNDAYRRLKKDYPEEEGYWLVHINDTKTTYKDI